MSAGGHDHPRAVLARRHRARHDLPRAHGEQSTGPLADDLPRWAASLTRFSAVLQLLALYVVVHVVRASAIAAFAPLLRRLGYGLTFGEGKPQCSVSLTSWPIRSL